MNENTATAPASPQVEIALSDDLAHGDALIGTIAPILRHLLANDDHSLFSDEIVARVRGMMHDVARQLLDALSSAAGNPDQRDHPGEHYDAIVHAFIADHAFLSHAHALALEWQLTERLQGRLALDPVLSPLVQALIASPDGGTSAIAMALLAAQARFVQNQRRMQLPLSELPADLLHTALKALRAPEGIEEIHRVSAETAIRVQFDESRSRLGLIERLIIGMGGGASAALSITHAGAAMFLSALSLASGQNRDTAVLSTNEGQLARLALALRASGLKAQAVEEQFLSLHPEVSLPEGFDMLGADRAAALLARSAAYPGS
ncbi:hypothetical protein [Novosphingobium arvoryzae]|uniref:DUF2336 domain-containing protein n=1 Tax=Novosphingobium arvoryzae TaxID=1256514 RepID=A0A918VFR4_9SPHN|nr:hypothetical protein [Novosphingobium arvoryzae]GGZ95481.1 hypothetical protein GCM10011617_14540 [Novosphingobium arvoryzae]